MENELDRLPISKLVLKLGLPAMVAQFFNILYSVVDRIFVGHIPGAGEIALASIGICAPALTAVTAFSSLVGIGGASLMSISLGRKDERKARLALNNAFILLVMISLILTVLALVYAKPLLYGLGCSDAMYPFASSYFKLYILGTIAVLCGTGMNQFILAFGQAKRGMFAVMIGALVNTILDPVLIDTFGMGIQGAALATIIAQFCVMVYVLWFLFSDRAPLKLCFTPLERSIVQKILTIGSLPFLIMLFDNLLVIALNFVLRKYGGPVIGDRYISYAAVVQSFMVLVLYPAQGITTGCGTIFSYQYGAGHYDKVIQAFRAVFLLCGSYMFVLCVAAQMVPETFARLFLQDPQAVMLAAACIRKYTLGLVGVAVQYAIVDGLTAMGQIRLALPISFFRKILYIVCVFLIPMFYPLEDVFYAETISDLVGAAVTFITFMTVIRPKLRSKMGCSVRKAG